jgi:predicted DCC family thiol-disulfide oxidoreductase YuxK
MDKATDIQVVYDKQCPVCNYYCNKVEVQESTGPLSRIDARYPGPLIDEITSAGLDIDEGMVLKVGDELFYGSEALHELALLSSRKGVFNRLTYAIFRSRTASRVLYPVLKTCRNLLLKILRRSRINNLGRDGADRF